MLSPEAAGSQVSVLPESRDGAKVGYAGFAFPFPTLPAIWRWSSAFFRVHSAECFRRVFAGWYLCAVGGSPRHLAQDSAVQQEIRNGDP